MVKDMDSYNYSDFDHVIDVSARLIDTRTFNIIWFISFWLFIVLGQTSLLIIPVLMLIVHCLLVRHKTIEFQQMAFVAFIGISMDSILSFIGVFQFSETSWIPLWLCAVWIGFATTLSRSLYFLIEKPLVASVFGACGGALSYGALHQVQAVDFGYSLPVTLSLTALIWAVLLPAVLIYVKHLRF